MQTYSYIFAGHSISKLPLLWRGVGEAVDYVDF